MFEGTDLSMAYGFSEPQLQQAPVYSPQLPPAPQVQSMNQPPSPPPPMQAPPPKQMVSVQQPNELPYQPPEAMYMQSKEYIPSEGFLQKVANRRFEVLKVVVFALIILFAISMDRLFTHYVSQYITESILTKGQEFLIRLSYPVAILLVIWFIKAM
jgi:hypothetical protein